MQYRTLSTLKSLPNNPRRLGKVQFADLCNSLKSNPGFFEARPLILSDRTGDLVILAGNMKAKAAESLGMAEVPTDLLSGLTEAQEREIIIRDNAHAGEWDYDSLANEWSDLPLAEWGVDLPADWNTGPAGTADAEPQIDRAEELREQWQTERGQLWQIGKHRLLCGDSTSAEDVGRILAGAVPNLMVTDPPYGVEYEPNWRNEAADKGLISHAARRVGEVASDDRADWRAAWVLFPGNVAYCWHASIYGHIVQDGLESCKLEVRSQIIWAKQTFAISRGHYHWQHECCWYAVRKGENAAWLGDHSQTTLWTITWDKNAEGGHSTQKPLECMARPIRNHEGDVYDPFLGSGTTMIAAEILGRICYGIEIEPKYCAVILQRMVDAFPGIDIKRLEP